MSKKLLDVFFTIAVSSDRLVVIENTKDLNENPYKYVIPQQILKYTRKFEKIHKPIPFWVLDIIQTFRKNTFLEAQNKVDKMVEILNKNKK